VREPVDRLIEARLRDVPFLGNAWLLAREIKLALQDGGSRNRAVVQSDYEGQADPWRYLTSPKEQERFRTQLQLLDEASADSIFESALEVGCGEGAFTELLAPRCRSLLAADISSVALGRARARCADQEHVSFREWDVRRDSPPGLFHLIVVAGVFEYFFRPGAIRRARDRLVNALYPGGHLLVETTRARPEIEDSWWAPLLVRGRWVNEKIARHPQLSLVQVVERGWYVASLFRKAQHPQLSSKRKRRIGSRR
jgi:SAM-dependent methyltransferase